MVALHAGHQCYRGRARESPGTGPGTEDVADDVARSGLGLWQFREFHHLTAKRARFGRASPEAKQSVQDIITRYDRLYKDAGKSGDRAALAHLRQEARQELAGVLNPAQLEEFFLRYSETAVDFRSKFNGGRLKPEEFRNPFGPADAI